MRKEPGLWGISLVSMLLVDVSFFSGNWPLIVIVSAVVYFIVGYRYYERIMGDLIPNSVRVFSFLLALMLLALFANTEGGYLIIAVSIAAIVCYLTGIYLRMKKSVNSNY
jgi:hypothetical protein